MICFDKITPAVCVNVFVIEPIYNQGIDPVVAYKPGNMSGK